MTARSAPSTDAGRPVLIVGGTGQDGFYLTDLLTRDGVRVFGLGRGGLTDSAGENAGAGFGIEDADAVASFVAAKKPAAIYYLAAHHRSAEDPPESISESLEKSFATHVRGLCRFLDAVRDESPETKLFYAASSHVFGDPETAPQTEETPFLPVNVYGITKAAGIQLCRLYRRQHGIYASTGILYNHESPRRAPVFVGRKIVQAAVAISRGEQDTLTLGDLSAEVDWGAAEDTVAAMRAILTLDVPDDFIVASGELHSIGEFVEIAFGLLGLDPAKHIETDPGVITKSGQSRPLVGDASKLKAATGWAPGKSFEDIIAAMVVAEQKEAGA
jgi:GDPmannose 4,6-dehydratase